MSAMVLDRMDAGFGQQNPSSSAISTTSTHGTIHEPLPSTAPLKSALKRPPSALSAGLKLASQQAHPSETPKDVDQEPESPSEAAEATEDDSITPLNSFTNNRKVRIAASVLQRSEEPVTPASQEDDSFLLTSQKCTPQIDRTNRPRLPVETQRAHRSKPLGVGPSNSSVHQPDYDDALRRVAFVVQRHIDVCERRRSKALSNAPETMEEGDFKESSVFVFGEQNFVLPQYKMKFVRLPLARPGAVYSMERVEQSYARPNHKDIYSFLSTLFKKVHLSSECSIICLIYIERLMEKGNVPLLAQTWRPICLCGLLLASKVWQDYACWNIEFAEVYPQFCVESINRLERLFVQYIKWDMYIKQSMYAQYYFALRSIFEDRGFRQRYNIAVNKQAPHMGEIEERSKAVKKEAMDTLSRSA